MTILLAGPSHPPAPAAEVRPEIVRPAWAWLARPVGDGTGFLAIGDATYLVEERQFEHDNGAGGRLWALRKFDGTEHIVCLNVEGELCCSCPDATYRRRECKHVRAVAEAYAELDRLARLDQWLAACEPEPAEIPF